MGKFFQSDKKQSGYGKNIDKTKTHGKYSDYPTKISKKIATLQDKVDTIVDTYKAVGKSLPISKKNLIKTLKNKIQGLKIGDKKQYEKKATQQNLQTTKNNPRLKAQMDEMNKEADKIKKLVEEGIITKGEARDKAKLLRKNTGGRLNTKKPTKIKKLKVDQKPKKRARPIDPRDIFMEGPYNTGGRKGGRGMGVALRGGGKVMRG